MRRLVYLSSARQDSLDILGYIAGESGSIKVARSFTDRFRKQCLRLASLPGTLGMARPELIPEIRNLPFQNYVIFSRYRDHSVEIVNVTHGSRDIHGIWN